MGSGLNSKESLLLRWLLHAESMARGEARLRLCPQRVLWVETLAALMSVWLLASSVTVWICAETGWTPTNIRKHQRYLVIYTLRGHTLHLTCFCNEFLFCWTGGIRTEIEGRKVDLSLFKGAVLVHLVSLFREAENVKVGLSTQTCAWEVSRALAVRCWCKRLMWPSLTLWHLFKFSSVLHCYQLKREWH